MRDEAPTIDILCKVIDNYGDIGVTYRLARALSDLAPGLRLRLVVDGLESFASVCPGIDPALAVQEARGWTVIDWRRGPGPDWRGFEEEPPRLVVECFACNRPDWFEDALFATARADGRLVVNLEYLTAEDWADDFHLLESATRSADVRKRFFMPGFTAGTGGLILDKAFMDSRAVLGPEAAADGRRLGRTALLDRIGAAHILGAAMPAGTAGAATVAAAPRGTEPAGLDADFWVTVFSYERDYARIVADLAAFRTDTLAATGNSLLVLAAAGKSQPCFIAAWEKAGRPFPVLALPFLGQETWDSLLLASDFSIVRGEDSLSRAALSGRPFLWQAYPQEGRHQLVKVRAFLERLRPWLAPPAFELLAAATLALNDRDADRPEVKGEETILALLEAALRSKPRVAPLAEPQAASPAAAARAPRPIAAAEAAQAPAADAARAGDSLDLASGFRAFAANLVDHGNLALALLDLLRDFR